MADLPLLIGSNGVQKRLAEQTDGSYAEVVGLAGGGTAVATFTPAAAAYGAGDIMDVAKSVTGMGPPGGGLVMITASRLQVATAALQASEAGYVLKFYSVTPPSARADNAAWSLTAADRAPIYLGELALGTPADLVDSLFVEQTGALKTLKVPSGGAVFAELVTVAAFTATAVARRVELDWIPA
jgi:hypothetical protein